MAFSNVWYSLSKDMYQIFASRFVVGLACSNYAPANSYLSYATSPQERAKIMTWNAASTVFGFICGPAFALLTSMNALHFTVYISSYQLNFNAETAPGFVSALFTLFGIVCLLRFHEVKRVNQLSINREAPVKTLLQQTSIRSFRSLSLISKTRIPFTGVIICLFFVFAFTAAFTVFETIGPLYTAASFSFNDFDNSLVFLAISLVSIVALAALQGILYFIKDERILLLSSGLLISAGLVVMYDWNNNHVSNTRFYVAITMIAIGFADGQAILLALFSKLLEEKEQGMMMGWLSSSGSMARMICPFLASYAYSASGNKANYIFLGSAALTVWANMGIIFGWREVDTTRLMKNNNMSAVVQK